MTFLDSQKISQVNFSELMKKTVHCGDKVKLLSNVHDTLQQKKIIKSSKVSSLWERRRNLK